MLKTSLCSFSYIVSHIVINIDKKITIRNDLSFNNEQISLTEEILCPIGYLIYPDVYSFAVTV